MSFQFSGNLDPSGWWEGGFFCPINTFSANQVTAPRVSGTLPLTHRLSPGPRSESRGLAREVSRFLRVAGDSSRKGDAQFFSQGARPGTAREELLEWSLCRPQAANLGSEAPPWPNHGGRLCSHWDGGPQHRAVCCFPRLLWSWGSGAGGPGQARASGLNLELAEQVDPVSKNTHQPSPERSGLLASPDPHLPPATAEPRTTLLRQVSISCNNFLGVNGRGEPVLRKLFHPGLPGRSKHLPEA